MDIKLELGGESKKQKGNTEKKDCLTKELILKTIGTDSITAQEIFRKSGYTGKYETLRGLLLRYQKFGYIAKEKVRGPYHYFLTDLGFQHLEDPFLGRENAVRAYRQRLVDALVKYADSLDDETVARIFKDRIIPPTLIKPPDKVTVKAVNIKVIDSKPATDLPKPSVGISGSFDTSDYDKDKIIAEQLETIHDQAQTIAELRNTPVHITVPKQITSASPSDDLHKHDALYLKYKNRIVDSAFFNELRYGLYEFTGTDSGNLSKAVCDILNSRVLKKGHIIFESYNTGGALEKYKQARRLSEEELENYPPTLQFGKEEVNLSIRYKNHTYNFFICSVASLKKPVRGFVKPPSTNYN